ESRPRSAGGTSSGNIALKNGSAAWYAKLARTNITRIQNKGVPLACQPSGTGAGFRTLSPTIGNSRWPNTPIIAVATAARSVKPMIHGFLRRRASDTAPRTGIARTMRTDETPFAYASVVSDRFRSLTSHTAKYSDSMFIENIV